MLPVKLGRTNLSCGMTTSSLTGADVTGEDKTKRLFCHGTAYQSKSWISRVGNWSMHTVQVSHSKKANVHIHALVARDHVIPIEYVNISCIFAVLTGSRLHTHRLHSSHLPLPEHTICVLSSRIWALMERNTHTTVWTMWLHVPGIWPRVEIQDGSYYRSFL